MQKSRDILGITPTLDDLLSLVSLGRLMIANAPSLTSNPRCAWDSSGLALADSTDHAAHANSLLIDIGGTHTKVASVNESEEIEILFDHSNEWFKPSNQSDKAPLRRFLQGILAEAANRAPKLLDGSKPVRLGMIWSNQVQTKPLSLGETAGITGVVNGIHQGGYRKGEWFLEGLQNGDDIGAALHAELIEIGARTEVILLGNDTVFTLFARHGAHSGTVVSSGANCTLVGPGIAGKLTVYNSELGGLLLIPCEFNSAGDTLLANTKGVDKLALEELCGGAWFSELCCAHIEALAELKDGEDIRPLRDAIRSGAVVINNQIISALLRSPSEVKQNFMGVPSATLQEFFHLAELLVQRAGALSAVLIYLSVSNQIDDHSQELRFSLDSSMARHFPGFLDSIEMHLRSLLPSEVTYSLDLIRPIKAHNSAEIPVPMIGLARALSQYHTGHGKNTTACVTAAH